MKKGVDYIGVGTGAVIKKGDRFFLSKRGKESRNEVGKWDFPGGSVDFGEDPKETIKREIMEEYDIEIDVTGFFEYQNHLIPEEGQHWIGLTFFAEVISGEPKIMEPNMCDEIGWFTLEEIEGMDLSITSRHNLESLLSKKNPESL